MMIYIRFWGETIKDPLRGASSGPTPRTAIAG
jgi:hypothetical protein